MNMTTPIFSVIIVSWNTRSLTLQAIQSILNQQYRSVEIIVVDNASSDDTVQAVKDRFPHVLLITNEENVGFARANNQGIAAARGQYFVLLNSDAQLLSDDIFRIAQQSFAEDDSLGILGGKLLLANGQVQAFGRSFLTLDRLVKQQLLFSSFPKRREEKRKIKSVDYVDGAFLVISRHVVDAIGLMREDYFMYGEDMEWCARASRAGWRVKVRNDLLIRHVHAASSKQNYRTVLVQNALNICRFMYEYEGEQKAKIAFDVFIAGMALRMFLSLIRRNRLALNYWQAVFDCFKLRKSLKHILSAQR